MGAYASDLLSTNQPFENRMFVGQRLDGGVPGVQPVDDLSSLVPLVENWDASGGGGETIASGFANWISAHVGVGVHDLLMSNCARGGTPYSGLQRVPSGDYEQSPSGTYPYLRGLDQVTAAQSLLGPDSYSFRAILVVHGEGDILNTNYDQDIRSWQADYEWDISNITGQTNRIPMFHSQCSEWGRMGIPEQVWSPFKLLEEYEANPDKTVLVCPKYMLPYIKDGIHLTSDGYRWLGEYYAKAYDQQIIQGKQWSPLRPLLISRTNNVILLTFAGVVGQLAFDEAAVSNPQGTTTNPTGSPDGSVQLVNVGPYGFEYWDQAGSGDHWTCSTKVTSVEIANTNQVEVDLNQPPQGLNRHIRYAFSPTQITGPGITNWQEQARGCLRDSDTASSLSGHPLYNWCVHFDKACP
jgi:hypothetical protein